MFKTVKENSILFFTKFLLISLLTVLIIYFDVFDLDIFGKQQILRLETELETVRLERESLEKRLLESNTTIQQDDNQKILLYATGFIVTSVILFLIYNSFFANGDDPTLGVLVEQVSSNSKDIIANKTTIEKSVENMITANKTLHQDTLVSVKKLVEDSVKGAHQSSMVMVQETSRMLSENTQLCSEAVKQERAAVITESAVMTDEFFKEEMGELTTYIFKNITLNLSSLDDKISKILEFIGIDQE